MKQAYAFLFGHHFQFERKRLRMLIQPQTNNRSMPPVGRQRSSFFAMKIELAYVCLSSIHI